MGPEMKKLVYILCLLTLLGCSKTVEQGHFLRIISVSIGMNGAVYVQPVDPPVAPVQPKAADYSAIMGSLKRNAQPFIAKMNMILQPTPITESCQRIGDEIVCTHSDGSVTRKPVPKGTSAAVQAKPVVKQTNENLEWVYDLNVAKEMSRRLNRPMMLAFCEDRCPPCKRTIENVYKTTNEASHSIFHEFIPVWCYCSAKNPQNYQLASSYHIGDWPSIVIQWPDEAPRGVYNVGDLSPSSFKSLLNTAWD